MSLHIRRVNLSSHSLNVAEVPGDGPLLILFHGITQRWQTFLPLIPTLALRHRLWLVDLRGHGESDRSDGYRVVDYVDDACELVDQLTERPRIYGHSLGAMVAAGVTARRPDRVQAAILEDPPLHAMGERIAETYLQNYFLAVARHAGSHESIDEVAQHANDLEFQDPRSGRTMKMADIRNDIQRRFSASCWRKVDPAVFEPLQTAQWLDGYDVDDVFRALACPTLLLQADLKSGGMLTPQDAEHVVSLNLRLLRVQFPGIGHTIHAAATMSLLNTVAPFLETIEG